MAFEFDLPIGAGATAVSIEASLEGFIRSLEPRLQKMSAAQLNTYMQPVIAKAFKGVVRKWRALLTRKGIDSSWDKPSGEAHIADALVSGPVSVAPRTSRYRKIIDWSIISGVDHLVFTLEGFGDVQADEVSMWGRQASLAAWANHKFGWNIPIKNGIVDDAAAKKVKVRFGGKEINALSAIIALSRAVNDNRIRNYGLAEALYRYITTAVFEDEGLVGAFLRLSSDFDI